MHHLYDTAAARVRASFESPYTVDGQPGVLPQGWVQIEDEHTDPPNEVPAGKTVEGFTEVDIVARKLRHLWRLVDAPMGPVKKLTIKARVRESEWAGLKAMLAAARVSDVPQEREIAEEWDDASVIDPADAKTQAVLASLTEAGILTTPLSVIFQAS